MEATLETKRGCPKLRQTRHFLRLCIQEEPGQRQKVLPNSSERNTDSYVARKQRSLRIALNQSCKSQKGLLSLPPEVRLQIWGLCLQYTYDLQLQRHFSVVEPQKVGSKFKSRFLLHKKEEIVSRHLVLSKVCRQMYREVACEGLIYKNNKFKFGAPSTMNSFLATIKPYHKDSIRRISLKLSVTKGSPKIQSKCFDVFASCKALEDLHLHISFNYYICRPRNGFWKIPEERLDAVRKNEGLRRVRSLKSFQMMLTIDRPLPGGSYNGVLHLWYEKPLCQSEEQCRYLALYKKLHRDVAGRRNREGCCLSEQH